MRKRILVLLLACALLLAGVIFGEGSYKPFVRLTPEDLHEVTVALADEAPKTLRSPAQLARCAQALSSISVLFTCDAGENALASLEVEFSTGEKAEIRLYALALSLDEKAYSLSPEESAALLEMILKIE